MKLIELNKRQGFVYSILIIILVKSGELCAGDEMRNITSMDLVKDMKIGWNLGNSFDAIGGETAWGNPKTTKAMIDAIKAKGFKTVRLPVTWEGHFGAAPDYIIDKTWLDRVEEVVNFILDNQMYAILNSHHDDWVTLTNASQADVSSKITKIWTQVAQRFKDYNDYLVFETLNEPRLKGTSFEWNGGTPEARTVLNNYNDAIVSAIRATGGNNSLRHIMIPTHAATAMAVAQDALIIPNDTRIIVSQHTYWPYNFSMENPGTNTWGSANDKSACDAELDRIRDKFVRNNIPVVIGEWGSINKNNTSARVTHARYYAEAVRKRGMLPVWWDNGFGGNGGFALLNRNSLSWYFPEIAEALVNGAETNTEPLMSHIKKVKEKVIHREKSGLINYHVSQQSNVTLRIYDIKGKMVCNLVNSYHTRGNYQIQSSELALAPGQYVIELKSGNLIFTEKILTTR